MFGIKGRDTFNNPMNNRAQLIRTLKRVWLKYFPYFLGFLALSAIIFTGYVWYMYVYTKDITPDEENAYINEKKQEVVFRKKKFDEVKDSILSRREKLDAERVEYDDIFYHTQKDAVE